MTDRLSRRRHLLALEPRMMFDAAAVATAVTLPTGDGAADAPQPFADAHAGDAPHGAATMQASDHSVTPVTLDHDASRDAAPRTMAIDDTRTSAAPTAAPHDIIFIDTSVEDYRQLASEWADKGRVVLVDGAKDGLAQVRAALADEHDVSAIHFVSHGEEGAFWLGTTKIDETSIKGALAGQLAAIGDALTPGGDILIYGCDFAEGADGASALAAFATATHADVAASTDVTGYAGRGGDWTLEAHRGQIEAASLYSADWAHTLDPNNPVPISASADSLTVYASGNTSDTPTVTGSTGYGSDARSPDVGKGAIAIWSNVAVYQGHNIDLRATVVSLSDGDAVRFNRPVGPNGRDGDDPTFLLRDLTSGNTPAQVVLRWELTDHDTGAALPADVRFTISDIDGIGGNPNTRESVQASTDNLTYYEHERVSDIVFDANLQRVIASGTQNENTDASQPISTASNATFDWSKVSSFTLTYTLAPNAQTSNAQFYQDGNATFAYNDPVYVSIPRLDLDADDSTAPGADAHFTFTENGAPISVADTDLSVVNPMPTGSPIVGASVQLTNAKAGDSLIVGTLPTGITAQTATANGTITVTLSGNGSTADYTSAIRAVQFVNTADNPDTAQRVIDVAFSNDTLTSNVGVSRIDVVAVNDAPRQVGTLPNRAASDADTVDYQTAQAFNDPDGDALTYSASGLPAGLAINAATGEITGTLNHRASQTNGGSYSITVIAKDPSNAMTTQTFTLTVTNPPPTAVDDSATTNEDTAVTINVLANDTDADHDTLTVTGASALHGSVTINPDKTLTYTPNADYNGSDTIHYTISDGDGGTSAANVAVTITPVEDAPRTVGTLPSRSTHDHSAVSYPTAGGFSDPDGDSLAYSATGLPAGLTIDPSSGVISGTVDRDASLTNGGLYHVVVTAKDPSNESATQPFDITVTNDAPTANPDSATTPQDTAATINVLANDTDPEGDPLTVTAATAQHGVVTINPDNTLRYTPNAGYRGSDTIDYTINDAHGHTATSTVAMTVTAVNHAPQPVGALPNRSANDADTVDYQTSQAFSDADGDTLTYSASGLPAGLTINAATGEITGTIDHRASQSNGGSYSVVVTAKDPANATATQAFTLSVANPTPTAVNDSATTNEDTAVTIAVLANDTDPDHDTLTVTSATAQHGSVVRNGDGTITYTPSADYNGQDTIHYVISDGDGGTSAADVAVTINPVEDAPRANPVPPNYALRDGQAVNVSITNVFSDPDGDPLTYSQTGLPPGLTLNAATGVISGTIDRSASQANGGVYHVTLTATDPSNESATQNVTVTVTDPPPVAQDDSATTAEDTPVTVAVLTNDSDPDGDPLTVIGATAQHGNVVVNPDNTLTYTPDADYNGSDTIHYTISDGQGGTAGANVAVTITPVEDAPRPVGTLPARSTQDHGTVSYPTSGGFNDPDGDALTYGASGLPAGLTIDPSTGIISGTVDRSASQSNGGIYHIVVTATDPSNQGTTQAFDLTIANPPPVAADDAASTHVDRPVTVAVLANDSDPDGDPLTVTAASAQHGTVAINPDGTLTYTPASGYIGNDSIAYTISDGQGGTASAHVAVTIGNSAPTQAQPIPAQQAQDNRPFSSPIGQSFSDPDGDRLTFSATGLPPGLTIDPATGTVSGTPSRDASRTNGGNYDAVVTATDTYGAQSSATVHFNVGNAAPVANADNATTLQDTPVTIAVLSNDSDPNDDPITLTGAGADHGQVVVNPDGTLTYTPTAGYSGGDTVRYAIADDHGNTAAGTVAIDVSHVNHAPSASQPAAQAANDGQQVSLDVGGYFRDPDGDPLRYAATGLPTGLSIDPATGLISGTLPHDASDRGPYRVTITATDPSGASAASSFDWVIANPAPVARDDAISTAEDTATTIAVLANDSDPDGDTLIVTAASAAHGSVSIGPDGTLRYTPNADFNGNDVVTYTITDSDGATAQGHVLVTVTPVNDAPVASAPTQPSIAANDGSALTYAAGPLFSDADGDGLTYGASGLPAGLSIDPATGVVAGTIDRNASQSNGGSYDIVVTASDHAGASATTHIPLTVTNRAPVAADDTAQTNEDTGIVIPVLGNDRDPDGDPLTVTAASADHGTVTRNADGTISYVPGQDFNGGDTIRYTIADGKGGTANAVVTVYIAPVEDAPILPQLDQPIAAVGGQPVGVDLVSMIRDPDGDNVTITRASSADGAVAVAPGGVLVFTPSLGFVGSTTVTYTADDGKGGVVTGTLVFRVADGRSADIEQLLRIGRVTFVDPPHPVITVATDGEVRNPLSILNAVGAIRPLNDTVIGRRAVIDTVENVRALDPAGDVVADETIGHEVARLDALRDQRDAGDRLFDHRWHDFAVHPLAGFSAAADHHAQVMIESVVRGGAIQIEVRDTAPDGCAGIRSVDVRPARSRSAEWLHVDHRGLAIVERAADMDVLRLVVIVTRTDGRRSVTPIAIQGATGEIEIEHQVARHRHRVAPLNATLASHHDHQAAARRLGHAFR